MCGEGYRLSYSPIVVIKYPDKISVREKVFGLQFQHNTVHHSKEDTAAGRPDMMADIGEWLVTLHLYSGSRERTGSRAWL